MGIMPQASQQAIAAPSSNAETRTVYAIYKVVVLEALQQGNKSLSISQKMAVFQQICNTFGKSLGITVTHVEQLPTDPIYDGKPI